MKKILAILSSAVAVLVVIFGTIYVVAQTLQRSEANYPQVQIAEDSARLLDEGSSPGATVDHELAGRKYRVGDSLAPFLIIYDTNGAVVAASVTKDTAAPMGILQAARQHDYHAVTWQPTSSVRIAAVTVAASHYYVLSGRSLAEVEKNEQRTVELSLFGGVASLLPLTILGYALKSRII